MRFAYWITSATNARSECAVLLTFARQQLLGERASILRDTYCTSCVLLIGMGLLAVGSMVAIYELERTGHYLV